MGQVAGCFPRRETRQCRGQMVHGLLMELDDHNCWTIADAIGHRGPHRLQHLLSRAVWDDQHLMELPELIKSNRAIDTIRRKGAGELASGFAPSTLTHCRRATILAAIACSRTLRCRHQTTL